MRILYCVQRYGDDIVGGAESACRELAEQLVLAGHQVEVVTSCARSYVDWANSYAPGSVKINGVTVHRLPVERKRSDSVFGRIHPWMMQNWHLAGMVDQDWWAWTMGPQIVGYRGWLVENAHRFDIAVFMTYLYTTTTLGLPVLAGRLPVVLQPTAHDEPPAYVPLFQSIFRMADSFLFFTPEEREAVSSIYGVDPAGEVVGMGIDLVARGVGDGSLRQRFGIDDSPYLVYVGRIDTNKGVGELFRYFVALKEREPSDLKLVLVGENVMNLPAHDDVVITGFVSEDDKRHLIADSVTLVQPSYFESFSIVVCEAWVERTPTLVQGHSEVLQGQTKRSGGGLWYTNYGEFAASVNRLLNDEPLRKRLGESGRMYVDTRYQWESVVATCETVFRNAARVFDARTRSAV